MAQGRSAGVHVARIFDETQRHHWRFWNNAEVSQLRTVSAYHTDEALPQEPWKVTWPDELSDDGDAEADVHESRSGDESA